MTSLRLTLLVLLVLLGNGLRSVISSAVFVSEGEFASFLRISVTQTSAIIELLLGAVLLSLLISPRLLQRYSVLGLASAMCAAATVASFGLAALFYFSPRLAERELAVLILFPVLGFALASLAPIAQKATSWGGEARIKLLTGVWAVAMPAAFLVTPQIVRVIAPRHGIDLFFALFATFPVLLILAFLALARDRKAETAPPTGALLPSVLLLVTFEAATLSVTLAGVTSPWTLACWLGLLAVVVWAITSRVRPHSASARPARGVIGIFIFLFMIDVATTGFYDTSYLVRHMCSSTLLADRATLGASAQVAAAVLTTALLAKYPMQLGLMLSGAVITALGLLSYLFYFSYPFNEVFLISKAVTGFGTGMVTTAAIFAVNASAPKGSSLALYTAFVIIMGTEVGLESFEILDQILALAGLSQDRIFEIIFGLQVVVVGVAILPFALAGTSRKQTTAG